MVHQPQLSPEALSVYNVEGGFDGSEADQWKELPLEVGADFIWLSHWSKVTLQSTERESSRACDVQ